MMETFHLFRSPRNAERLRVAIDETEDGGGVRVALSDDMLERSPYER